MITLITDLQFGSTGKGLLAGYLARHNGVKYDGVVTAWAPNAGHTYVNPDGTKVVNIAMPTSSSIGVVPKVFIGPGSIINPEQMLEEIKMYGMPQLLSINENAAVVTEDHRLRERSYGFKIGSTMKGVGEAAIQKIRRHVAYPGDEKIVAKYGLPDELKPFLVNNEMYWLRMDQCNNLLVEGAQGYSLGINAGFWPHCTSRDCTTHQLVSDCGIPVSLMWEHEVDIWGACRTFPIRVANRYSQEGAMIGTSGPCYPDQEELNWNEVGVEPELTTVTKLPRRIFTFSGQQVSEAIFANGTQKIFLNFANYANPKGVRRVINMIESRSPAVVELIGYGPKATDIKTRSEWEEQNEPE
jgi:adenylosuccinate synthase